MGRKGRPRKAGARYRNGNLKPTAAPTPREIAAGMPHRCGPLRSFHELGDTLGLGRAKHGLIDRGSAPDRAKPGLIDRSFDEVGRTKQRFDRRDRERPFTSTALGRAFFARSKLLQKLAAYIASPEAKKPPRAISRLVRLVDWETLALVAVDALINRIVAGWDWNDEACGMKLALAIGKELRDEIEIASLRDRDKIGYQRVMRAQNRHVALSPYRTLEWSNRVTVAAGWWLINECALKCDLFDSEQRRVGRNLLTLPKIADGHWDAIKKLWEELSLARPYYFPHRNPPPAWTSPRTEYDDPDRMPATFVRDEHPWTKRTIEICFENAREDPSRKPFLHAIGVNHVQRVPWMINEPMVEVVERLACHVEKRFKTLAADDAECFKISLHGDIALARNLIGSPFWTPYNIDFRGRLNALPHFHIGREDRVRSLFMFWNGRPVGDSANWLEIAVANAKGEKGTWRDRHDWVFRERDLIRRVAADPLETVKYWKDFSDPFQFVAACRELISAQNDPNFVTHLPVFLDGTSNGIQHLACMARDEDSGRLVNLMDLDERLDIYDVIGARVKLKLEAAGDEHAEWWLSPRDNKGRLFRALFKRPVMTFSYGVTKAGVRNQIVEAYKEEFGREPQSWHHVNYLAEKIIEATKEILRRPDEVMKFIRGLAGLEASRNLPLKWITPSGLGVTNNRCYEPNIKTVELKLHGRRGKRVEYKVADGRKDKIKAADAINGAPANFVHSMDAAHLVIAVIGAVEEGGITDIAVIHDCYGSLAPQVECFQHFVRLALYRMYESHDVLGKLRDLTDLFRRADGCAPLIDHALPERGSLDLSEICRANYSFT